MSTIKQLPPVTALPILRSRPDLVKGTPVALEMRDFAPLMPVNRFHENPPLFMLVRS